MIIAKVSEKQSHFAKLAGRLPRAAFVVVIIETIVVLATGELVGPVSSIGWLTIFQHSRIIGLLDCAVLDIVVAALLVPMFLAIYMVLKRIHQTILAVATVLALVGIATSRHDHLQRRHSLPKRCGAVFGSTKGTDRAHT